MAAFKSLSGLSRAKAVLGALLLIAYLGIEFAEPDYSTKAPLFALISAAGVALGIIHRDAKNALGGAVVRSLILFLSAASGITAAWFWLLSVKNVDLHWQVFGVILLLVSIWSLAWSLMQEFEHLASEAQDE